MYELVRTHGFLFLVDAFYETFSSLLALLVRDYMIISGHQILYRDHVLLYSRAVFLFEDSITL